MSTIQTSPEQTNEAGFNETLLERFFNPKSYFLQKFMTSLNKSDSSVPETAHAVTVGLIMDEIINSENKLRLFKQLDQFDEFRRYHEQLDYGIDCLKNSRLTTQQMMDIVGALGQSLSSTLLDLLSKESTKSMLLDIFGLESTSNGNGNDHSSMSKDSLNDEIKKIDDVLSLESLSFNDEDEIPQQSELSSETEIVFSSKPKPEFPVLKVDEKETGELGDETENSLFQDSQPETPVTKIEEQGPEELSSETEIVFSSKPKPEFPVLKVDEKETGELGDETENSLFQDSQPETPVTKIDEKDSVKLIDEIEKSIFHELKSEPLVDKAEESKSEKLTIESDNLSYTESKIEPHEPHVELKTENLKPVNELFNPQESDGFPLHSDLNEPTGFKEKPKDLNGSEIVQQFAKLDEIESIEPNPTDLQPWSYFQDDVSNKLRSIRKNIDNFCLNANDWKSFKKIKNDFKDLRDGAMIQGDEGIEALSFKVLLLFETAYMKGIEKRSILKNILNDAWEAVAVVNSSGKGSERLDIVRLVAHQIDKQREVYPEELFIQNGKTEKAAPISEKVDVKENSNNFSKKTNEEPIVILNKPELEEIYEFNEPEPSINETEIHDEHVDTVEFKSIRESELLTELMEEQLEAEEDSVNRSQLSENLSLKEHPDSNLDRQIDSLSDVSKTTGESDLMESSDLPLTEPEPSSSKQPQPVAINLPGEADEDLLEILEDIKNEESQLNLVEPANSESQSEQVEDQNESNFDFYIEKLQKDYEANQTKHPENSKNDHNGSSQPDPGNGGIKGNIKSGDTGDGYDFVSESDMYFSFARKSLQNLMRNPSDSQSLEDIELAFYSLKTLAKKLGYKTIYQLMAYAENLISNKKENESSMSVTQVNGLYTAVSEIEHACREKRLNEPERQSWINQQIKIIQGWSEIPASLEKEEIDVSPVQLEKKENPSDDPLDFLLFDDTSKFFKQLLRE